MRAMRNDGVASLLAGASASAEIAAILARGYVRLLAAEAEKARNSAISSTENSQNPLDLLRTGCAHCGGPVTTKGACKPA